MLKDGQPSHTNWTRHRVTFIDVVTLSLYHTANLPLCLCATRKMAWAINIKLGRRICMVGTLHVLTWRSKDQRSGPVAPISVNCTVSSLTHFTLLLLADLARELLLSWRWCWVHWWLKLTEIGATGPQCIVVIKTAATVDTIEREYILQLTVRDAEEAWLWYRNLKTMIDMESAMDHFDAAVEPHLRHSANSRHCQ